MKRLALILPLLLAVAGCATVHGAGQDISKAGDMVSDSARKVQSSL